MKHNRLQTDSYRWRTPGFILEQSSMHHRRGRVCVPHGGDLPQELGGLLDEQSLHGLSSNDQGNPLGFKPPPQGTHRQRW